MSEKHGIIDKIKSSFTGSKKHDKILRALYRAGRRKAILEHGHHAKDTSSSSGSPSEEEINRTERKESGTGDTGLAGAGAVAGAGAAHAHHQPKTSDDKAATSSGTGSNIAENAAGAAYSQHITGSESHPSHKGKVVKLPPRVNRQPSEKNYGGDYSNAKIPTELARSGEAGVVANAHPQYDNSAQTAQGEGTFFNPLDTQGGVYGGNTGGEQTNKNAGLDSGKTVVGSAAIGALAGGVARGGSGHAEAAHAELDQNRDLKTKPGVYSETEKKADKLRGVEKDTQKEAYQQVFAQGVTDASTTSGAVGSSSLHDRQKSHEQNKSTVGDVGMVTDDHGNSSGKAETKNAAKSASKGTGVPVRSGAVAQSSIAGISQPTEVHAGLPPSSSDFDYQREMKRLDKNIDTTQTEIDQGKSGNSGVSGKSATSDQSGSAGVAAASTTSDTDGKTLDPAALSAKPIGIFGTAAAALGFGGTGAYAAHRANEFEKSTKESSEAASVASLYHQPGVNSGNDSSISGSATGTYSKSIDSSSRGSATGGAGTGVGYSTVESDAYSAGVRKGEQDIGVGSASTVPGDFSGQSVPDKSDLNTGLLAGAAAAVGAVGAAGAAALGLGLGSDQTDKVIPSESKRGSAAVSSTPGVSGTQHSTTTFVAGTTGGTGDVVASTIPAGSIPSDNLGASTGSADIEESTKTHSESTSKSTTKDVGDLNGLKGVGVPGGPNGLTGQTSWAKPISDTDTIQETSDVKTSDKSLEKNMDKHSSHSKGVASVGAAEVGKNPKDKSDKTLVTGNPSTIDNKSTPGTHVNEKGDLSIPVTGIPGVPETKVTSGSCAGSNTADMSDQNASLTGHDSAIGNDNQGYLDSAKIAVASAGAVAAGAFGYEGYNQYYKPDDEAREIADKDILGGALETPASKNDASKDKASTSNAHGVVALDSKLMDPAVAKATEPFVAPLSEPYTKTERSVPHDSAHGTSKAAAGVGSTGATVAGPTGTDAPTTSSPNSSKKSSFLSKLGFGGRHHVSSSGGGHDRTATDKSVDDTSKHHTPSDGPKIIKGENIGKVVGSAAAAGAVSGLWNKKTEPLVGSTTAGLSSATQSQQSANKGSATTNADFNEMESDVIKFNAVHGHNGRTLIEIAEDVDPNIKKLTHNAGLTDTNEIQVGQAGDSARHRTPP